MSFRNALRCSLSALTVSTIAALPAAAQTQAGTAVPAMTAPAMGDMAPDFTAMATDSTGRSIPVSLSAMRGKVVVLAFYPLDRSQGCTIELHKFRDEYGSLFGDGVVVLPTSIDTLSTHASWAKDAHFPFALIADPTSALAMKYGSNGAKYFRRTIYVIGKDGRIVYAEPKFNALGQDGYDKLSAAIKAAKAA